MAGPDPIDYDPGAGLSEASAFEERMDAGWYDEPNDDYWDDRPYLPKRRRCLVCDTLDWHEHYVSLQTVHGRWIAPMPVCESCRVGLPKVLEVSRSKVKTYKRSKEVRALIAEQHA